MTTGPTTFLTIPSPVGDLVIAATGDAISGVYFATSRQDPPPLAGWTPDDGRGAASMLLARARDELGEYFDGTRTRFDLPLAPAGSVFERRVWDLLREIPYGTTTTYGALARRLGDPRASRAVGAANGRNPIPIIVPCHRVVGARGELTGFGGGIACKRWLLEHEGALIPLGA
jgi:methylated-DNA-[protein]-cysteine S-methyltransferase